MRYFRLWESYAFLTELIFCLGDRYEGEFKGCLKHGNGNEKFSNGDSYSGMYVNGRPEG